MRDNWRHALHAALLLLPGRFTDRDLFTAIAGLSYAGDIRMKLGKLSSFPISLPHL
jgi:mitochondrial translocator assembly and maintenance protein 41